MECPPQSDDLNPIENMWMAVKGSIGSKVFRYGDDLFVELQKQRHSIISNKKIMNMQQNIAFLILSVNILKSCKCFEHLIF